MSAINIIGGSGFIGTRLSERLRKLDTYNFKIIDKIISNSFPEFTCLADVRSVESLRSQIYGQSTIINLAAEHRDDVKPASLYDRVNVDGAKNICQIASEKNIYKIIFTSSVAVYGFAEPGTNEMGKISPFNDYGRTKHEAEQVYLSWQAEDPSRTLVIIRPTVVFGESNRGNVFNLLKQIASGKFVMIGDGLNRKSIAYVENVAAFIEYSLGFGPGVHIYNYIDKPDFTMNTLVSHVNKLLGRSTKINLRVPYSLGLLVGMGFDLITKLTNKNFPISAIRVKKFCANSVYESAVESTGFMPPVPLMDAVARTIRYEFIESNQAEELFYSE